MPYIICVVLDETGQPKEGSSGLAERAYHREELAANQHLRVDVEYYLSNQVCSPLLMQQVHNLLYLSRFVIYTAICVLNRDTCFGSLRCCQSQKHVTRMHVDAWYKDLYPHLPIIVQI